MTHAQTGPQTDFVTRIKDILDEQAAQPTGLRRRLGATFGTPSSDLAEAPPSADQEANMVLSGGGLVRRDGGRPSHRASRTR
ncbi:MAG TPA: hypothetical protein VFL69_12575 [Marmoricola sp.]|jgi:hypothetical protein|nr:hypothetical protein [Marmoricola sp.]